MIITKIKTHIKADTQLENLDYKLNYWISSSIRGAIIAKLSDEYCMHNKICCKQCENLLCPVKVLFYTDKEDVSNNLIINSTVVNKEEIDLNIILFGQAIVYKNILLRLLKEGIEINSNGSKIKFKSFDTNTDTFNLDMAYKEKDIKSLTIKIESPLRLQESALDLSFESIARIVMTRIRSIERTMGIDHSFDYKELSEKSKEIVLLDKNTRIVNLYRYSTNHNRRMEIKCLDGYITYTGDNLKYFYNILKLCETFNIGKWTTMGLGQIRIIEEVGH